MSTNRRGIFSAVALMMFSGCSSLNRSPRNISRVELELINNSSEDRTFHFVLEHTNGLDEWITRQVAADERETIEIEPSTEQDIVACHGIVSSEVLTYDFDEFDSENACVEILFTAQLDGDGPAEIFVEMDANC